MFDCKEEWPGTQSSSAGVDGLPNLPELECEILGDLGLGATAVAADEVLDNTVIFRVYPLPALGDLSSRLKGC